MSEVKHVQDDNIDGEVDDEMGKGSENESNVVEQEQQFAKTSGSPTCTSSIPLDGLDSQTRQLVMAWYWAGYYHGLKVGQKSNEYQKKT